MRSRGDYFRIYSPSCAATREINIKISLEWAHKQVNHRYLDCVLNRLFRWTSKKTSKLRVTGLCDGSSISWRHCDWQIILALQWRHNGRDGVSNHQPHDCLINRLFRCRSKKISTLRVTGLCKGNSPVTGEIPAQMASNAESVSIWWYLGISIRRPHMGILIHFGTWNYKRKSSCI